MPCFSFMRRALERICRSVKPGVSSMNIGEFFRPSHAPMMRRHSSRDSMFLRSFCPSTPPFAHKMRCTSCCLPISKLKNATPFEAAAMFSAMLRANAVLPIDGRAAKMIISPRCRPLSISSSSSKPVGTPVTCLPSFCSSVRMVSSNNSRKVDAARASRRCAIAKMRDSASPSVMTGSCRD